MGRYRLGNIIKMTRTSLSMTQKELSEGICSAETLSRIESGRRTPNKETYELLMERMGRTRDRTYSLLTISELKMLENIKLFEEYIKSYNFMKAENILISIKKTIGSAINDRQFLLRAENLVKYRLGKISVDKFLDALQQAIQLTIPQYGEISLKNWPLNLSEATLLLNISTAYAEKGEYIKAIRIMEEANQAIQRSYMDEQQRVIMQVSNTYNLSKWYGLLEQYETAIEIANDGIKLCKEYKLGNVLPHLIYNIAWNMEKLQEKGVQIPEDNGECLRNLRKAYYIANAMQQPHIVGFLTKHIAGKYKFLVKP